MQRDPHAGPAGQYTIRSLYFDDPFGGAYYEKIDGVCDRLKYRIRCYNYDTSYVKLECKEKHGSLTRKRAKTVTAEQAAALQQKIEICEIALAEQTTPWQGIYLSDYAALMGALGTGNFIAAEKSANGVAASLALRDATATQTAEALRAEIAALQAQLQELVAYVDAPQSIPTDADGYFYRTVDGYEALFGTAAAQNLSPEGLETLLNSPTDTADCIGKMLRDGTWYLALPADAALAATYEVGASYTVRFESAALSTLLVLEQINFAANGESALLLLRGDSLPEGLDVCRRQSVLVEKETVQGLSVPAAALNEDGTVFVNENGVARVRRLSPVCDRPLLSLPGEAEGFLREGEQILVSTRSLYDGKVLE
jgi:hypothetical protein